MVAVQGKIDLSAVEAVIVEPERGARSVLRNLLGSIGITNITAVGATPEEVEKVEGLLADMVLVDATDGNDAGFDIVRRMRSSQIMRNPFAVTMVTTFAATDPVAKGAVRSGADGLLAKPLSNNQMTARIQQFIAMRRPFQVTGTYIGPDIGRLAGFGATGAKPFEVPNTLRLKASGRWRGVDIPGEIDRARVLVMEERIRRDAFEIALNLEMAKLPGRIALNFDALRRVPPLLEDLLRLMAPDRRAATADLVAGLRTFIDGARAREAEFIVALPRLRSIALQIMALLNPGVDPPSLQRAVQDALPAEGTFIGV
jgi:CheY-like chemotaxis protein